MRYRITDLAERDLDEIFAYWAPRAGLKAADRLVDSILERFWILGQHPQAGKHAVDVAAKVRCFPAGRYLIYCRVALRRTEILHIYHGVREQKRTLKASAPRYGRSPHPGPNHPKQDETRVGVKRRAAPRHC